MDGNRGLGALKEFALLTPQRYCRLQLSAAKLGARVGDVHEKGRPGGICLCIHRREDQRAWDCAGRCSLRWAVVRITICFLWMECVGIFAAAKMTHLSDGKTVAKMGHPMVVASSDVGHRLRKGMKK